MKDYQRRLQAYHRHKEEVEKQVRALKKYTQYNEVINLFIEILRLQEKYPQYPRPFILEAMVWERTGKVAKALHLYEKVRREFPTCFAAYTYAIELNYQQRQYAKAKGILKDLQNASLHLDEKQKQVVDDLKEKLTVATKDDKKEVYGGWSIFKKAIDGLKPYLQPIELKPEPDDEKCRFEM